MPRRSNKSGVAALPPKTEQRTSKDMVSQLELTRGSSARRYGVLSLLAVVGIWSTTEAFASILRSTGARRGSPIAMQATRTDWYRRVQRVGGDQALFEVTIPKPLGMAIREFPRGEGIGVSEIIEGGNCDKVSKKVYIDDESGMWVLEGDKIMGINGVNVEDEDMDTLLDLIKKGGNEITFTLMRNTRKGPIKVVMMPGGESATVRRGARLSQAAEYAFGKELKYGCIDGWCGTCWHRERVTNEVFKPCSDVLTGDWDNVMPLVLTPKPEKAGDGSYLKPRGAI